MKNYNNYSNSSSSKSYSDITWVVGTDLINFLNINSHNWSLKNGKLLALKKIAKKMASFMENSDFWQYLPNLVPPGNPDAGYCWVRLGSSTWNVLWSWNNNERRLRLLEKNNWRKQLRSLPTDSRQSRTKLKTKQRLKTLTLLEHCHVMCTYLMYCEFVRFAFIVSHTQEESNPQQYRNYLH